MTTPADRDEAAALELIAQFMVDNSMGTLTFEAALALLNQTPESEEEWPPMFKDEAAYKKFMGSK